MTGWKSQTSPTYGAAFGNNLGVGALIAYPILQPGWMVH